MEFFSHKTNIDFMAQRKWAALFSAILFIISLSSLAINGLNMGLDFTGGTQVQVAYPQAVNANKVRDQLNQAGFEDATAQVYGSSKEIMIRLKPHKEFTQQELTQKITKTLDQDAKVQRVEFIGPQVGKTLMTNGILAIIISLIAIMLYIALRFEYRFALSAALSLIHDPVIILGVFAMFHMEFDLIALAAVLTVLGYSLNDTIVVYDRARENFRKIRQASSYKILNLSVNETLSRTIITSSISFFVVTALLVFGGRMLHGFSITMMLGIIIGTYSSIYVAGALALIMGLDRKSFAAKQKAHVDDRP